MNPAFEALLAGASAELYADNEATMASGRLIPTPNVVDEGDVSLFFAAVEAGIVTLRRGGRFDTFDRPTGRGRWGLLSRSRDGGWYNAEYLPQLAAYADAILRLGYPKERVLFELPAVSLQLDLAILDDRSRVVLGEAKREVGMLEKLRRRVLERFADEPPGPETKRRGDEARQLAWRLWTVRPDYLWLIAPGERVAFRCAYDPLVLTPIGALPAAGELGLDGALPRVLAPPSLVVADGALRREAS